MAENDIIRTTPDVCSCVNAEENSLHLEVALPGVKKENISLKMNKDSFNIVAKRDEHMEYATSMTLSCPVDAAHADSVYEDGLLKIDAPFKDSMEDALDVPIH